ncbi:MAG: hypothetical protein M1816_004027 [Peltula sp. TS41687]|nr:MAG: hypothetical protein M1816_004027 [Peltula sp. TS41687]
MNKYCDPVPTELLQQANKLVAEYKRVVALPSGPARVPEVAGVKLKTERFTHCDQAYCNRLKREAEEGRVAAENKSARSRGVAVLVSVGGSVARGPVPAVGAADDGVETVKDKLDKVIANGNKLIDNTNEPNRLLRSIEGLGERLLTANGVPHKSDDDDEDDDGDDGAGGDDGDAEMAG